MHQMETLLALASRRLDPLAQSEYSRRLVRELLCVNAVWGLAEKLQVCSTAAETLLHLGLILHNEGLAVRVDDLGEWCRDGVLCGLGLDDETLVASETREDGGLLNGPLARVREDFTA